MSDVAKAGWFTPLLHVKSIERSLEFYKLLGFEVIDTDRCQPQVGWARMHCEGGAVMFLRAEVDVIPDKQGVIFAMYTPDLAAFRAHLLGNRVKVPEISYPEYMPSGSLF